MCFTATQSFAVEVITHSNVADVVLTKSQLRRIYTMRQLRWNDNSLITVFVLPSQHELHQRFAKEQLQIFPYQLNRIWHKLTYSGLGVAPIIVNSEDELLHAVISTPGSIGYIDNDVLNQLYTEGRISKTATEARSSQTVIPSNVDNRNKGVVNVVITQG